MKRSTLLPLAVAAAILTAGTSFGLDQPSFGGKSSAPEPTKATPPAKTEQKLVKVAHLPTAEANREFQTNVQLIQAQRQAAVQLNSAIEKETDPKKKASMQAELDQLMTKLNENNEKMVKAYGFSLNRNYVMEIEASNIYLVVTPEEAEKMEKEKQSAPAKK